MFYREMIALRDRVGKNYGRLGSGGRFGATADLQGDLLQFYTTSLIAAIDAKQETAESRRIYPAEHRMMERKKLEVTKTMTKMKVLGTICGLVLLAAAIHAAPLGDGLVAYGNTRFNTQGLDFAAGVTHEALKAAPLQKDTPPGDEWPAHIEFKFPHYFDGSLGKQLNPSSGEPPLLAVYPTADFAALQWDKELKGLKALLKKRSGGGEILAAAKELPYLPVPEAAQMLHADAIYLSFKNGTGIRYITHYAQDVAPYTAGCFFYTYQGLTNDGKTYVSATFPLYTILYPKETPANFDYKNFDKQEATYRAAGIRRLNAANLNTDFMPSIARFDRLIASIEIEKGVKPVGKHPTTTSKP
ncbi:MAG: uncharacterized protein JWN14_764 [Chthonomonadales bacterium]|nr:uncharacterized protein [Chthonomonadales bacterium]